MTELKVDRVTETALNVFAKTLQAEDRVKRVAGSRAAIQKALDLAAKFKITNFIDNLSGLRFENLMVGDVPP